MFSRRSFLRFLGIAPVAAPAVIAEAAKGAARGGVVEIRPHGLLGSYVQGEAFKEMCPGFMIPDDATYIQISSAGGGGGSSWATYRGGREDQLVGSGGGGPGSGIADIRFYPVKGDLPDFDHRIIDPDTLQSRPIEKPPLRLWHLAGLPEKESRRRPRRPCACRK